MPDHDELIGSRLEVAEIRDYVGADSLAYLSIEGMLAATQIPPDAFCTACFSSRYPVPVPAEELRTKHVLEDPNPARGASGWPKERG
jgi:amidophosphoribosyltransferase